MIWELQTFKLNIIMANLSIICFSIQFGQALRSLLEANRLPRSLKLLQLRLPLAAPFTTGRRQPHHALSRWPTTTSPGLSTAAIWWQLPVIYQAFHWGWLLAFEHCIVHVRTQKHADRLRHKTNNPSELRGWFKVYTKIQCNCRPNIY